MLKNHEWTTEENFLLNYLNDFYKGEYFFHRLNGYIEAVNKLGERVLANKVSYLIEKSGMYWGNAPNPHAARVTPEEMKAALAKKPYLGSKRELY